MSPQPGARVRYVGMTGRIADGPVGRVVRVTRDGLHVRWDNYPDTQVLHPEGVTPERAA